MKWEVRVRIGVECWTEVESVVEECCLVEWSGVGVSEGGSGVESGTETEVE